MPDLQTLTIVKTDITGFTARSSAMSSSELATLLEQHRALARRIAGRFGGTIFKEIGDSYLFAFRSATAAVQAAVSMQRELSWDQAGSGDESRIGIRATVATGDVLEQDGDYFGEPVNLAARMEEITPEGEVYVAETARQALNRAEIELDWVDEFRFKGIPEPVRVYRALYGHATRVIRATTVTMTDILRFSQFTSGHSPPEVEKLIDFWDSAHREVLNRFEGAIRLVKADSYLLTFPSPNAAVSAVFELKAYVDNRNSQVRESERIGFVASIEVGDVNIYRTAIYGEAVNRADFALDVARHLREAFALLVTDGVRDRLPDGLRAQMVRVGEVDPALATRMARRGLKSLWKVCEVLP